MLLRFLLHSPPGRVSSTWPLSSTSSLVASSAGGQAGQHMRASSSMRWSRHFMIGVPLMAAASCITRIAAFNTCPFGIPSDWQKLASSRLFEASATVTTTPSLRRSTVSTRPKSFIDVDHGAASRRWNSPPWNGSIGSIIDGFWSLSGIYRQPKPRTGITPCWTNQPWPHNLNETASGKPGAVHTCINSDSSTGLAYAQTTDLSADGGTPKPKLPGCLRILGDAPSLDGGRSHATCGRGGRDHQCTSRRRAAPELSGIPSSLNPRQISATIESRHRWASNADLPNRDRTQSRIVRSMDFNFILCNGLPKSYKILI